MSRSGVKWTELDAMRHGRLPGWVAPAILLAPFVVGVAALHGLTVTLPIFHSDDELVYHYPLIKHFGSQVPFPDLARYNAAQTPLFHLLLAYIGKAIGYQLWRLRFIEVLISYGLGLTVYLVLRRRLALGRPQSLSLTLLFVLSPYVYGTSFRLITDNLATLFVVVGIERFERFRQTDRLGAFATGCAAVAAAMLTRQSAAFMMPVAGLYALRGQLSRRNRALAVAAVGLAVVPVGALFLTWHGLVPPGGDPSSCGLCPTGSAGSGATEGKLVVQSPELALAAIGLYGAFLFAPTLAGRVRRPSRLPNLRRARGPITAALAGSLLLLLFPARPGRHAAGLIWNTAGRFPALLGSSLVFWALVPLAGAILCWRIRVAPRRWLVTVFLGCFLIGALAIRYPWQKYVDPFALLALMFTVRREEFPTLRSFAGAAMLSLAFIAYTLDTSSHRNTLQALAPSHSRTIAADAHSGLCLSRLEERALGPAQRNFASPHLIRY